LISKTHAKHQTALSNTSMPSIQKMSVNVFSATTEENTTGKNAIALDVKMRRKNNRIMILMKRKRIKNFSSKSSNAIFIAKGGAKMTRMNARTHTD
jgi:hypothetical protein